VRSAEEKTACKVKKETKKVKAVGPKRKPGRPKGSKNKYKSEVLIRSEFLRIQKMVKALLQIGSLFHLVYLAMDVILATIPLSKWCGIANCI
jgi:hypothetical protein